MSSQHRPTKIIARRKFAAVFLLSILASVSMVLTSATALAEHGSGGGATYSSLEAGFTQDLVGTTNHPVGDLAWASDDDLFLSECQASGSELHRYDLQSTTAPINATILHPESVVASNAGCGLITHPNGNIYSNTTLGIVEIDGTTGSATGLVFGSPGNALGIAVHPTNNDIVYVGLSPSFEILRAPVGGVSSVFVDSRVHLGGLVDEIVFDSSGLLYMAMKTGSFRVVVANPDGTWNRSIAIASEPNGLAYHETGNFLLVMHKDGTITKIDLGAGDAQSSFASGGSAHRLSTVGADGCLYNTQAFGTTYDDGTATGESSIVRICDTTGGGFIPPTAPPPPPTPTPPPPTIIDDGHMKGNGKIAVGKGKHGERSDWSFKIECDGTKAKFKYKNHSTKDKFKLESVTSVTCIDSGSESKRKGASFDTLTLVGTGKLNGVSGSVITVTLTDLGKHGKHTDTIDLDIDGETLAGALTGGNHKAYK